MVLVSLRLLQLLDAKVKLSNLLLQLRNLLLSDRALVQALNRRDNSHLRLKKSQNRIFLFPGNKIFSASCYNLGCDERTWEIYGMQGKNGSSGTYAGRVPLDTLLQPFTRGCNTP
jgi:hypothetical protein